MKQGAVKKKMLECVIVRENDILSLQAKNQMETLVMRKRINYLSVVGKVTLKIKMRKKRKTFMKTNILEYVSVGEKVEFINTMRK